jgi:ppGpp synthetase/RelA/SpoT-type nucleotidyltranferase
MRDSATFTQGDLALWSEVVIAYLQTLTEAEKVLTRIVERAEREWGVPFFVTVRPKITRTIIEKLRRENGMALKGIQDIAGARITADMSRRQQDALARRIAVAFASLGRPPRMVDRRSESMHGYRAVHVVVHLGDIPVEVQLRTKDQDAWAQVLEKVAGRWGRDIRYGGPPTEPHLLVAGQISRAAWVEKMKALSAAAEELDKLEASSSNPTQIHIEPSASRDDIVDPDDTIKVLKVLAEGIVIGSEDSESSETLVRGEIVALQSARDRYYSLFDQMISLMEDDFT